MRPIYELNNRRYATDVRRFPRCYLGPRYLPTDATFTTTCAALDSAEHLITAALDAIVTKKVRS